ncbi:hypothetical protein DFH09DRAFT_402334 [Mycena vulgaris]|nr:hypothetical protein DFH09DRAFT_402334 [Mycena vulgaris]
MGQYLSARTRTTSPSPSPSPSSPRTSSPSPPPLYHPPPAPTRPRRRPTRCCVPSSRVPIQRYLRVARAHPTPHPPLPHPHALFRDTRSILLLLLHNALPLPTHSSPSAGGNDYRYGGDCGRRRGGLWTRATHDASASPLPAPSFRTCRRASRKATLHVHSGQALLRPPPRTRERKGPGTRGGAAKRRALNAGEGGGCRLHAEGACARKVEDGSSRTCACTRTLLRLPALRARAPPSIPPSPASSLYAPGASLLLVRRCAAPPHPHPFEPKRGLRRRLERWRGPTGRQKRRVLGAQRTGAGRREWGRGSHVKPTMGSGPCASFLPRECQVKRMGRWWDDCGYGGARSRLAVRERWDGRRRGRGMSDDYARTHIPVGAEYAAHTIR